MPDDWLNVDTDLGDAKPQAAAALLTAIADTVEDSPASARYDVDLTVRERGRDE